MVTVGFAEPDYSVGEGDNNPQVCVVLTEGVIERALPPVTVVVTAMQGTAIGINNGLLITLYKPGSPLCVGIAELL